MKEKRKKERKKDDARKRKKGNELKQSKTLGLV